MSIADYAKRKYDFLTFQNVKPTKETQLGLQLYTADTSGKLCVGIQKLTQRWVLEFLTELGSMAGQPTRGCTFMTKVRSNAMHTQLDVIQSFYASALRIRTTLQIEEYAGMPDDERFADVNLLSVAFAPGYLNLSVNVISRAGTDRAVILPIETLP